MTLRRLSPTAGWFAAAAAVIAAFLLFGVLAHAVSPSPSGRALSSYATTPRGEAAWAELLSRDGHSVTQLRTPLARSRLPAAATLVILSSADLSRASTGPLQRLIDRGGRVVLGGDAARLAARLHGEVIAVPHPRFLENRALGDSDNAFRALALAGPSSRPVYFNEVVHGYGPAIGLAALPERWWFAIAGLAIALVAWALSHTARLGGSDPVPAPAPSPRAAYIEAMAQTLARAASRTELEQQLAAARDRAAEAGRRLG